MALFTQGRDVSPDATEDVGPLLSAETVRDFLLQLAYTQITFSQVVVKGDLEIRHKTKIGRLMKNEAINQITGIRLGDAAPLAGLVY